VVAAAELLQQPLPAKVVGESVKVVAVERQGNDRRGLVAQVRRHPGGSVVRPRTMETR